MNPIGQVAVPWPDSLELDAPCPCASGTPTRSCCMWGGGLLPRETKADAGPPKTNASTPKCYASPLVDCGGPITKEHSVSKSVLRLLNNGSDFGVLFAHTPAQEKRVRPETLKSGVLCKRHNNALAPFDAVGSRFFRESLDAADFVGAYARGEPVDNRFSIFSGHDIERWILKAGMGGLRAGHFRSAGIKEDWPIPEGWLKILFEGAPLRYPDGLYVIGGTNGQLRRRLQLEAWVVTEDGGRTCDATGFRLSTGGLEYNLVLDHVNATTVTSRVGDGTCFYRPWGIVRRYKQLSLTIGFGWQYEGSRQAVVQVVEPAPVTA